ncbi:MAG: beta-galactosidase trimerization domain-containing protein [Tepidisphaerales bacterium]
MRNTSILQLGLVLLGLTLGARGQDAYEHYVKTSKDFVPVKQDPQWLYASYPSWTYMPWTYQWTIGYTDESGKWSLETGYNGAFLDRGDGGGGKLDWINKFQLRFYVDHLAGKGDLHLWDGNIPRARIAAVHGNGVRVKPVNAAMADRLKGLIRRHIASVKDSPMRAAYALDDEISWGHFVHPTMWNATDDPAAYPRWLKEIYGADAPVRGKWVTYEDIRPSLRKWTIATFDASPLVDQWTFNDSYWNNFLGDLVEYSNSVDPRTPCGYVGGQCPNAFGGYDYAKLMRKIQFLEAYNIGSAQAIARSFNPGNAMPLVTTYFHRSVDDGVWQTWYYLAHGNRGMIGWVEKWFDGKTPKDWHARMAPTYREANDKIGPLLAGATWVHDGVAIYYSHASIQLGWILDAEAHGKTWINRNGDETLGASHLVRRAWENMLRDSGIQYSFVSYADVIQKGVPNEYKVLILPAVLCLSDAEAKQIRQFAEDGGTVIADYLPGLWDQHGKGRPAGGALDDLFGVKHDPRWTSADLFGVNLWCEVDQDANFSYKNFEGFLTKGNTCIRDGSGFNKVARAMPVDQTRTVGKGKAVLMNLSPQWYNAYRQAGLAAAARREMFMKHIPAKPWVRLAGATDREFGHEIVYWDKADRRIVCLCLNPDTAVSSTGGGNSVGLKTDRLAVKLEFEREIDAARDERTGKDLGRARSFELDWKMNEGVVLSFRKP